MLRIRQSYLLFLLVIATLLSSLPAVATEASTHYDRVSLQATASAEVENDILVATLSVYREGSNPALLSEAVNADIRWAIEAAKKVSTVTVQTLGYQTNPLYQQQRLSGWRVRQSLRLESEDITALSQLLGRLQERLAVEQVGYRISPQRRNAVEEALIAEAITRFQQRATLVAKQMGRSRYRVVDMNIESPGGSMRPLGRVAMSAMVETRSAPRFEWSRRAAHPVSRLACRPCRCPSTGLSSCSWTKPSFCLEPGHRHAEVTGSWGNVSVSSANNRLPSSPGFLPGVFVAPILLVAQYL